MELKFANIIIDLTTEALNKSFVFKVPESLEGKIKRGDKVIVPFGRGNKDREGYVLEILSLSELKEKKFYKTDKYFKSADAIDNLKEIKDIANTKIAANDILLKIAIFLYREYAAPIATCINTVLPVKEKVRKNKRQVDVIENYEVVDADKKERAEIELNAEQKKVVKSIIDSHKKNEFDEHLVFGITGSGKTEVYIKVIEEVLKEGKQVIVLIPEIALTHQTVIRLKEKFDENIAIIHSRMSKGERYIQYQKCESGETKILVGPRSAIFAPFENLGLIVIDEVNDESYNSDTTPRYKTLDVARFRCSEQKATLISLSATPNVDLYYEAENGNRIKLHKLNKRASSTLPKVILVDMKKETRENGNSVFSKELIDAINDRLEKKEQVMLYMNRRGYDTIFTCKGCGETIKCPHCDVTLVSHNNGRLMCHYCGYEIDEPLVCPTCKSKEIEKYGMGTEKLEELAMDLFPNARILRMDRDTTKEKNAHDKIIKKFRDGKADILIGTQMIVKGHDFPNVTLVAVMRGDLASNGQDYKASENAFSMITQCVGRSGRKVEGESIIEAYDIESISLREAANQDYLAFYEKEIERRKKLNYPPFAKLLYLTISCELEYVLDDAVDGLKAILEKKNKVDATILGPTKTNPEKIKDTHYRRIIIKCKTKVEAKQFRSLAYAYIDYIDKSNIIKIISDIE